MKDKTKIDRQNVLTLWCKHVLRMIDKGEVKISRDAILRKQQIKTMACSHDLVFYAASFESMLCAQVSVTQSL